MRKTILLFSLFISWTAQGQIVNNLSSDKTNIYIHAIDSVTRIIISTEKINKIYVYGDTPFPDKVNDIEFVRGIENSKKKKKFNKLKNGEARFIIGDLQIIRDQFKVLIYTWGQNGYLGDGGYTLRYQYVPGTRTYELREIEKGIVL